MTVKNNENENKNKEALVEYVAEDGTNVKLTPAAVKDYIAGNSKITNQEFVLFASLCKARKLNPFTKEAYLIKYGENPAQMVVSKDAILKRAVLHPKYDGKESGIIVSINNEIKEIEGCFLPPNATLLGGWCKVYRKDRSHPEYMSVSLDEVMQKKSNGEANLSWATKPATMVEKVAKVRALREAFVDELAGMYDADELKNETAYQPINESTNQIDPFEDDSNDVVDVDINEI